MHESAADIEVLQRLLDRSYEGAGPHLLETAPSDHRLTAEAVARALTGVRVLAVATVTSDGRPLVSPVDGLFHRGQFWFGSGSAALRLRHLAARPALSAAHFDDRGLAVTVHGIARIEHLSGHPGFRRLCLDVYGDGWQEWGANEPYARIEAERMFAVRFPPTQPDPIRVRTETETDHGAVNRLVAAAFGRAAEAEAVAALRSSPGVTSLVAVESGEVIGHVMLSPVTVDGSAAAPGLAPLAVRPDRQRRGVGGVLVRAAIEACRRRGDRAVFVLGDPGYYGRFGFADAAPFGLRYHEPVAPGTFQLLEISPGSLSGLTGEVRYHQTFDGL
jgi:predicted N-acetyltransferase YhbS